MPTDCLFREDAYLTSTPATVLGLTEKGGIVVDRTCFYATSGGQPGDSGMLVTAAGEFPLAHRGLQRPAQDRDRACAGRRRRARGPRSATASP